MKLTIGVMGSSGGALSEEVSGRVFRLGQAIAEQEAALIAGGCPGLPYEAVRIPCPQMAESRTVGSGQLDGHRRRRGEVLDPIQGHY